MTNSEIKSAFDDLFKFENEKDQYEVDAKLLMAKFLSELNPVIEEKGLKRKELAEMIGTSASYLTQLYRGHKLINLITLAKLQKALDVKFAVGIEGRNESDKTVSEEDIADYLNQFFQHRNGDYIKVVRNYSPQSGFDGKELKLPSKVHHLKTA